MDEPEDRARPDVPAKQHRTVNRVTTILETVAADPHGVRLNVLAGVLDAPKTSVHALVKGLVATGYLHDHDGVYLLGPAVGALLAPPDAPLIEAARPEMRRLYAAFDETVMLATFVGGSVVYLDTIESTQVVRYSAPLRTRRPIFPTSSGKCFLAGFSTPVRGSCLDSLIEDENWETVMRELDQVATEGVAYNRGETVPDVSAVASAVSTGRAPASIAIAGPTGRVTDRIEDIAQAVRDSASRISARVR